MEMPINLKLRKRMHKDIAYAQDILINELYKTFNNAIIHGGTAIWRCYKGNRFSEDVDVYIEKDKGKIEKLFESLKRNGFKIIKKRIKENSLYSVLSLNNVIIRFEAIFKHEKSILKEYENSEGTLINVYTLTPEKLIEEKINTYLKRKRIRDLYDIFFLLRCADKGKIEKNIKNLLANFRNPIDEGNLKAILISPPVPKAEEMLTYIEKWVK